MTLDRATPARHSATENAEFRPTEPERVVARLIAERYDRPSKVSDIAGTVAYDIIIGAYAPGEEINSVTVSRRFQTSRAPVREAFLLLEKESLITLPPRRRPCVRRLSIAEIEEDYRLRMELLSFLMHEICARASDADIDTLNSLLTFMITASQSGRSDDYFWATVTFYERAVLIARNGVLKRTLDTLLLGSMRLRRLGLSLPSRVEHSIKAHLGIMQALLARDAALASALMRSNLRHALQAIVSQQSGC